MTPTRLAGLALSIGAVVVPTIPQAACDNPAPPCISACGRVYLDELSSCSIRVAARYPVTETTATYSLAPGNWSPSDVDVNAIYLSAGTHGRTSLYPGVTLFPGWSDQTTRGGQVIACDTN